VPPPFLLVVIISLSSSVSGQGDNPELDIRQGDFRQVLEEAIANGEQFDAISIDAFPNSADEVNRDASSREVIELALQALKPGGVLTFYPDSRYLPARVIGILQESGIPLSSIHYTMGQFDTSNFTRSYHYGELMSIPSIQKPLVAEKELADKIKAEYEKNKEEELARYEEEYPDENQEAA